MGEVVNVFITSKNRDTQQEKPYNWTLKIPSGLISCDNNHGLKLNVMSFHIPNNFYNINSLNDRFDIIIKDQSNVVVNTISFSIYNGNYSVNNFKDYINTNLSSYISMTYSSVRNMYNMKSVYADTTKKVFIKPINSAQFFGLDNNIEKELTSSFNENKYTVNMCSFDKIVLQAYNISVEKLSIENIGKNDPEFERSSILLWCSRTDVPINGMIKYDNMDGGNSYSYNLYDKDINAMRLLLTDEYGNKLTSSLDYTMLL
jgi:hypothetical protein